jgi:hypothetical protein
MEDQVLIYDVSSFPMDINNFTLEDVAKLWKNHQLVIYDSKLGQAPSIVNKTDDIVVVDISK